MVGVCMRGALRMCSGTWALNAFMRALGARIGARSRLRMSYCLPHLPDCLTLGDGCAPRIIPLVLWWLLSLMMRM